MSVQDHFDEQAKAREVKAHPTKAESLAALHSIPGCEKYSSWDELAEERAAIMASGEWAKIRPSNRGPRHRIAMRNR